MRLTLAAENSILILFFLARQKRRFSVAELSKRMAVPANHIYKLVQALGRGGYLKSFSGKVGGVELAVSPSQITLLEVIEHIEGPIALSNCVFRKKVCTLIKSCVLKSKLAEAQRKFLKILESSTIKDLAQL